jgi:hypothetical protein
VRFVFTLYHISTLLLLLLLALLLLLGEVDLRVHITSCLIVSRNYLSGYVLYFHLSWSLFCRDKRIWLASYRRSKIIVEKLGRNLS